MIYHQDPSQHVFCHVFVPGVHLDKLVRNPDHTLFLESLLVLKALRACQAGKGQKGCTPCLCLLQVGNHSLGSLLILCDNILDAAPKSRLYGGLVLLIHLNDVRNDADNSLFPVFAFHHLFYASAISLIALGEIGESLQL